MSDPEDGIRPMPEGWHPEVFEVHGRLMAVDGTEVALGCDIAGQSQAETVNSVQHLKRMLWQAAEAKRLSHRIVLAQGS